MFAAEPISYPQTNAFSKLVMDYVEGSQDLRSFYSFPPTIDGIQAAIDKRKTAPIDRATLVAALTEQYKELPPSELVLENIRLLNAAHTFTVCTAHQPNLLTGPLYFIYKIIHAIKLAKQLQENLPLYHFVPVYYMGCEDADLEELNHFSVRGKKYVWNTDQQGAVGRMKIDAHLVDLISELNGQIGVEKYGSELIQLFNDCYTNGALIQHATTKLVHALFSRYGLVIVNPDNRVLKEKGILLFENDVFDQTSAGIVTKSSEKLNTNYKVQAHPREINLFYLKDNIRKRIIRNGDAYEVHETDIRFTRHELKKELHSFPERFSPNVILRGAFQEIILPNIAFIGGGGELAYWLQLKDLFDHYDVPFPVQVLRNSFMIIERFEQDFLNKLNISTPEIFMSEIQMLNNYLERRGKTPQLNGELAQIKQTFDDIASAAKDVDSTLAAHALALKTRAIHQLETLEKKMLKAERRKHAAKQQQLSKLKAMLFPSGGLQERVENFSSYYAKWGPQFIDALLDKSLSLEQKFIVLKESKP